MNSDIKKKIVALRKKGYGYKKIAKEIGESVGVVRHLCVSIDNEPQKSNCLNCGLPIKSITGKKEKKFCCDKCRYEWWNKKHKEERKIYAVLTCKFCGKEFNVYYNEKRVYCSHECYVKDRTHKGGDKHD